MIFLGKTGTRRDGILTASQQAALDLRQEEAARKVREYWDRSGGTDSFHPALALPTGIGKGRIAHIIMKDAPHSKVLLIVGTKNILLQQNREGLASLVEEEIGEQEFSILPDTTSRVTLATWQGYGAWQRRTDNTQQFGLWVIDEFHNAGTRARINMRILGAPQHVVGMSATSRRSTGKYRAPEDYGFMLVDTMPLPEGIGRRWLSPMIGIAIDTDIMLPEDVREGESLNGKRMYAALKKHPDLFKWIARDLAARVLGLGLKTVVAVNRVQEEACVIARELEKLGFKVGLAVNQKDAKALQGEFVTLDAIERYKLPHDHPDAIQVLISPQVIGEGFDAPATECVVWAAPTLSSLRYTQVIGRGARRFPGKAYCLVLDYVYMIEKYGYSLNFAQFFRDEELQEISKGVIYLGPKSKRKSPHPPDSITTNGRVVSLLKLQERICPDANGWLTVSGMATVLGVSDSWVNRKIGLYRDSAETRIDVHGRAYPHYPPKVLEEFRNKTGVPEAGDWQNAMDMAQLLGVSHQWIRLRLPAFIGRRERRRDRYNKAGWHYPPDVLESLWNKMRQPNQPLSPVTKEPEEALNDREIVERSERDWHSVDEIAKSLGITRSRTRNLLTPYRGQATTSYAAKLNRTFYPHSVLLEIREILNGKAVRAGYWITAREIGLRLKKSVIWTEQRLEPYWHLAQLRQRGNKLVRTYYPPEVVDLLKKEL